MKCEQTKSLFTDALAGFEVTFAPVPTEGKGKAIMLLHPDDYEMIKKQFEEIEEQ